MKASLRINIARLRERIDQLGRIGALAGGGVCRLALTDADRAGRDQVCAWMRELGLSLSIDRIGNVVGVRPGLEAGASPVLLGSHIDTVATGGLYDGNLGVLAGLEIIQCLTESAVETRYPVAVGFFTNEEGARFAPDMMGSAVHQARLDLESALATRDGDGLSVAAELERIGYAGEAAVGVMRPRCFLELHVEQGPVLEQAGLTIGAVTGVQGISWTEYRFTGVSNHAGTTPMRLRHDAGFVAAAVAVEARAIAAAMGGNQVATVGLLNLRPNLVNVIAREATITVDLRNTDEALLCAAEARMQQAIARIAEAEGVTFEQRCLARFEPVEFDPAMVERVETTARGLGFSVMRLPSGAGHDAQMFAPACPSGMIFVPSQGGISHNVREFSADADIGAGADVLLQMVLELAGAGGSEA